MSSIQKILIVVGLIVIIVVSFIGGLLIGQKNVSKNNLAKTYNLDILNLDQISSITIDTLSEFGKAKEITDKETIEKVYNVFNNKTTQIESVNDNPINPEILFSVTFKNNNGDYKLAYIYKKDNKYYIEQPYNGIYETSLGNFKIIEEISK